MVRRDVYEGKPLLVLLRNKDDRFGFAFGLMKAKLILENIEGIQAFVKDNEPAKEGQSA